jgi:hypothetical protein
MSILIFAIIVIILVALLCYAVSMLPLPSPFNMIIQCLLIVVAVVIIANRAGVM